MRSAGERGCDNEVTSNEPSVVPSDERSVLTLNEPSVVPSDERSVLTSNEPSVIPSNSEILYVRVIHCKKMELMVGNK